VADLERSPSSPSAPEHATHDPLRVAEAADRAGRLPADLAACPDCVALHADLVALASALPASGVPARPRDYRLTPADAARLRPGGWRRWLGTIGSSRDVITRPLAIGFTTLGLAGLLVATVPGALPGGAGTALAPEGGAPPTELAAGAPSMAPEAPAAEATSVPMPASQGPAEETDDGSVFTGVDETDAAATARVGEAPAATAAPVDGVSVRDDLTGVSALVVIAGLLMLAGLSLFGLRWTARHLG
jgi:hypothetical protein